jgi:hypothetical protein
MLMSGAARCALVQVQTPTARVPKLASVKRSGISTCVLDEKPSCKSNRFTQEPLGFTTQGGRRAARVFFQG